MRNKKTIIGLWIAAFCLAAVAYYVTAVNVGYTQVSFIDVGQGDSCFIKTERGTTFLIDGGDYGSEYELAQFIRKNLVSELDAVFLSHMHSDHIAGVVYLLEQGFPIDRIYLSDETKEQKTFDKIGSLAAANNTELVIADSGTYIEADGVSFFVVAEGIDDGISKDENDNSLIIRFECGENSILFTGDASVKTERELLGNELIDTDFLKVGHHGSATSSSADFLEEVSPEVSIISVGADNKYGHPSKEVISKHKELDIPIMRTDKSGTITMIMDEKDIKNIYIDK